MKAAEIIKARRPDWKALEADIAWCRDPRKRKDAARLAAFAQRYRAVCGDLSLAKSMRFPSTTTSYLHELVADAHLQLYRSEKFRIRNWVQTILFEVPRRIVRDPCFWISLAVFWGLFLGSLVGAMLNDGFAEATVGDSTLRQVELMYSEPVERSTLDGKTGNMTGFYIFNNAGIGLRCFASGIILGVGSLVTLAFNAVFLGTLFGYMMKSSSSDNFITFVTAHGPFELTAVVLSAAAGLRLGWAIIDTKGQTRMQSLHRTSAQALEVAAVATVLFLLAAYIEGYVSPSELPYAFKAVIAVVSTLLLIGYLFGLGLRSNHEVSRAA